MAKDNYLSDTETGNWNSARQYSEEKIMKWLGLADEYEILATFGISDLVEEFMVDENTKRLGKIKGLTWLIKTLMILCDNTWFAVKLDDREIILGFKKTLEDTWNILPVTYKKIRDDVNKTTTIKINEKEFNDILNEMIQIKRKINEPLNKADLIFINKNSYDPKKRKADIIKNLSGDE